MAIFFAVKNKKQTKGALLGVLKYVIDVKKTMHDGHFLASGYNCNVQSSYLEMLTTKQQFRKTDGRQFYQFVQSFPADTSLTAEEIHQIGLEFAEKRFADYEVVVATHCNTENLHNHFVVNSVSFETGMKLHQNHDDLTEHRRFNDEICRAHGQIMQRRYRKKKKQEQLSWKEYRAAKEGKSWKFALIQAIEEALQCCEDKESFIKNMKKKDYQVTWSDNRKYITYTCPNGMKCRDNKLHDETYLKENMEKIFAVREIYEFPLPMEEPPQGWLTQANGLLWEAIELGYHLENMTDVPEAPSYFPRVDSKQKQRIAIKKLALGHKFSSGQSQDGIKMY